MKKLFISLLLALSFSAFANPLVDKVNENIDSVVQFEDENLVKPWQTVYTINNEIYIVFNYDKDCDFVQIETANEVVYFVGSYKEVKQIEWELTNLHKLTDDVDWKEIE